MSVTILVLLQSLCLRETEEKADSVEAVVEVVAMVTMVATVAQVAGHWVVVHIDARGRLQSEHMAIVAVMAVVAKMAKVASVSLAQVVGREGVAGGECEVGLEGHDGDGMVGG